MLDYIKRYWALALIVLAGIAIHLIPLVNFGAQGLGYDAGFYRRHIIKPFVSFPNTLTPGLGDDALLPRIALDSMRMLGIPADIILFGSHILLWALGAVALFCLMRKYFGMWTGITAVFLFTISPMQYVAYWFVLWKHAFALPIFFLLLLALERRSYWAIILALTLSFSHNTTSAFTIMTLGVFFIIRPEMWRITGASLMLMIASYLFLHPSSADLVSVRPIGVFVPVEYFLWNIAPLVPFALLGITRLTQNRSSLLAFVLTALAFPMAQMPFWERIMIFADIALIVTAACGISLIVSCIIKNKETKLAVGATLACALFLGIYLSLLNNRISDWDPFMAPYAARAEIANIPKYIGPGEKIITTTELAPLVFGWSTNKVIAPGLLGDTHNQAEWILYWGDPNHPETRTFLAEYGTKFYFFIPPDEQNAFIPENKCVRKLSEYIVEYYCVAG